MAFQAVFKEAEDQGRAIEKLIYRLKVNLGSLPAHAILIAWSAIVLLPLWLMVINSLKLQIDIFRDPFALPEVVTLAGYTNAWTRGHLDQLFRNSIFVTAGSLFLILFLGSLAAYALANWRSKISSFIYVFLLAGLMIPMRLGTINILQIIKTLNLTDNVVGLIPIYVAMGMPIATFVLTPFIRALPRDLLDAARIDGASEWDIYRGIVLPIVRPGLATVLLFNTTIIWNDLWFPLILIRSLYHRTLIYGVSLLFSQTANDWSTALAMLALSAAPVLIIYALASKQFVRGLTAGAMKG
jgi:raffinose/stachyose/melibiose transport system permease protein